MTVRTIDYNDETELRRLLVGHRIIGSSKGLTKENEYDGAANSIKFFLDNGVTIEAVEAFGGCSCSNGDWSVESPATTDQIITNVEVIDEKDDDWGESATLRMFVYADEIKTELVRSEGGDNGYYGWGYHVLVHEVTA